jgi:exonuclease III
MNNNENIVKIMSYNIWFDDYKKQERIISLIKTIDNNKPDVICMQEVTIPIFNQLKTKLKDYPYYYPKKMKYIYNCVIFSKYLIVEKEHIDYKNSKMCRGIVSTVICKNIIKNNIEETKYFVVSNSHFESEFGKNNVNKLLQYTEAINILEKYNKIYDIVIFCADTNIQKEEKYINGEEWIDVWKECGKNQNHMNTYDSENNRNLIERKIKNIKERLDRIIIKKNKNIQPIKFELVKNNNEIEASDHFGIISTFIFL